MKVLQKLSQVDCNLKKKKKRIIGQKQVFLGHGGVFYIRMSSM